ncbi:MinD/ParA family protein [Fundidesulfovibrio terrae]|uniref:MinD/ParA family protein n=1 Tax=Fundidesulfovibrio terrae TaxID=2922866 RepID=UPI001FAEBB85|nr:MinD/ParA family protein [Fundidesulfovibrio terrae]
MSRVLAVASGKGGTGKTSISVNLALGLGRLGRKVCLLDADLGLSNVDVLLGISPELTLEHVLFEGVPMEKAVVRVAPGLDVVPGGSGVSRLADLSRDLRSAMSAEFSKLSGYDYLVVDGSPGISSQVISLCLACPELLVVVNPDPSSITDAYALVKVLSENGLRRSPYLLVNKARSRDSAGEIFARVRGAMLKYLKLDARYLGHVPQDPHVSAAAARQRPLMELFPASGAGRAILGLAKNLDEARLPQGVDQADPASVMEGTLVRMRESSPFRSERSPSVQARRALDSAINMAGLLENPGRQDRAEVAARLKSLLVKARSVLDPGGLPLSSPPVKPQAVPVRVAVISSDTSIGDILSESLGAAGMAVNTDGGRADAAVVFWRGSRDVPERRLAELGNVRYVYVRSVASKEVPLFGRGPAEVMDMPFKLEDLAGAVRRCASGPK